MGLALIPGRCDIDVYNVTHETQYLSDLVSSNSYSGEDANPISKKKTAFSKQFIEGGFIIVCSLIYS